MLRLTGTGSEMRSNFNAGEVRAQHIWKPIQLFAIPEVENTAHRSDIPLDNSGIPIQDVGDFAPGISV